ncbi:MAG: heme NO-binding domain-containing protein [Candidatus Kariarchaeaceae archaeon]|jgi:hypothetical protein
MMSELTFKTTKEHSIEEGKPTIVELFHAYCSHKFGNDTWHELMNMKEFNKMINQYQPKYGDVIFSVLADTVAETQHIPIKDLLYEFSEFIRTYY